MGQGWNICYGAVPSFKSGMSGGRGGQDEPVDSRRRSQRVQSCRSVRVARGGLAMTGERKSIYVMNLVAVPRASFRLSQFHTESSSISVDRNMYRSWVTVVESTLVKEVAS